MRPAVAADGFEYYEYIMVYVDDLLFISLDAQSIADGLMKEVKFKGGKIAPPEMYLGARLAKKSINNYECWSVSSVDYINAAIKNVEEKLAKEGKQLPSKADTPMSGKHSYYPELDNSDELEGEDLTYYQELIGILRWAIELGRVDINHEVSVLSQFQASPREGHMEEIIHIFGYLKKKPKLQLIFTPQDHTMPASAVFNKEDTDQFLDHYRGAKEDIHPEAPPPRGYPVQLTAYVDASHAANKSNRRSHTGYIIFAQRSPLIWYSKMQKTVESAAFGAEFIAMKTVVEHNRALRFKLRMFGVPIEGPTRILTDNEAVFKNSSRFESTLNKKHNSVAYHVTRWAVAAKEALIGWIPTKLNLADPFTKRLPAAKRNESFGEWTY